MSVAERQRRASVARRLSDRPGAVPAAPSAGVAIVGPPGSGKTTRLTALACAYRRDDPMRVVVAVSRSSDLMELLIAAGAVDRMADLSADLTLLSRTVCAGIDAGMVADDAASWCRAVTTAASLEADPRRELLLLLDDAEEASAEAADALAARSPRAVPLLAWHPTGRPTDAWLLDLVGTTIILGGWTSGDHAVLQGLGLIERASQPVPLAPELTSPQWRSLVQSATDHAWDANTVRELAARAHEQMALTAQRVRFDSTADWVRLYRELG